MHPSRTVRTVVAAVVLVAVLAAPSSAHAAAAIWPAVVPVELLIGAAVVLALPVRAASVLATLLGIAVGLTGVLKLLDVGFSAVLTRPFDLVLDPSLLADGFRFVAGTYGSVVAIAATILAALVAGAVVLACLLSARWLAAIMVSHRSVVSRALVAVTAVALAATLAAPQVASVPRLDGSTASLWAAHLRQAYDSTLDRARFQPGSASDAYASTPGDHLLTGLAGKNVLLVFVESYGRSAVENPDLAPAVVPVLDEGSASLRRAGIQARSGFLTSATTGGSSWLAHSTLLSGLWVDNQQRYRTLMASDRLTLTAAFGRAGWHTLGVMPGLETAWPEQRFYGYDQVVDSRQLGYRGPRFGWATTPDQFTLAAYRKLQNSVSGPTMAVVPLVSSHAPWTSTPQLVDWDRLGDGTIYAGMGARAADPSEILSRDPAGVRADYRHSIGYSMSALISYLTTYPDDDLVMVVLGDHQPSPLATNDDVSRDVPISVIARDPAVLRAIQSWHWTDGLRPAPTAPVWRMDAFRDRFLAAYGPRFGPR